MTQARPIPESVRALLPLCGAENDHEALGACRGIGRKLQAAGLDWHDLAAAIPTGEPRASARFVPAPEQAGGFCRRRQKATVAGWIRPFDAYSWRKVYTPRQEAEHRARVRFCQDRTWQLSAWERDFLDNVARLHGNLSIKQGDRLAGIADRLDMEARRAC